MAVFKTEIQDIKVGSGPAAKAGDTVSVHSIGTLADGTKFDRSRDRGPNVRSPMDDDLLDGTKFANSRDRGRPFSFTLGQGRVILGWDVGVHGMQVGGLRKLKIPAEEGYGARGAGNAIPANAALVFEVEMLKIQ